MHDFAVDIDVSLPIERVASLCSYALSPWHICGNMHIYIFDTPPDVRTNTPHGIIRKYNLRQHHSPLPSIAPPTSAPTHRSKPSWSITPRASKNVLNPRAELARLRPSSALPPAAERT